MWGEMLASIVTPSVPPKGIDATTLGSIMGYTGFASGFNFMLINYYRDHGYAHGAPMRLLLRYFRRRKSGRAALGLHIRRH